MRAILRRVALRFARVWRNRELAKSYAANLCDAGPSVAARVEFHLHHLRVYWNRYPGFFTVSDAGEMPIPELIRADWIALPLIASAAAAPDVEAFCRELKLPDLLAAWRAYLATLEPLRGYPLDAGEHLERAVRAFDQVDEVLRER